MFQNIYFNPRIFNSSYIKICPKNFLSFLELLFEHLLRETQIQKEIVLDVTEGKYFRLQNQFGKKLFAGDLVETANIVRL